MSETFLANKQLRQKRLVEGDRKTVRVMFDFVSCLVMLDIVEMSCLAFRIIQVGNASFEREEG